MKCRLKKGTHIFFHGKEFCIENRLPSGDLQLKDITTNDVSSIAEQELIQAVFSGMAEIIGENQEYPYLKAKQEKTLAHDFPSLDEDDPRKKEAQRRFAYIKP